MNKLEKNKKTLEEDIKLLIDDFLVDNSEVKELFTSTLKTRKSDLLIKIITGR